ncbi:hypothetical protein Tco_0564611 [Tanacetum coccineum]
MAGIINKIGDALHIGGNKDEDKNKKHETEYVADHKKHEDGKKYIVNKSNITKDDDLVKAFQARRMVSAAIQGSTSRRYTWMAFGGNTRDLGSFGEKQTRLQLYTKVKEEEKGTRTLETASQLLVTASEHQRDGVRKFETASGLNRHSEALEDLAKRRHEVSSRMGYGHQWSRIGSI